jgi:teichuronic acid biosynthesis glycosyltransferase TuaG
MSKSLVSVITPVFNAARFLPETILSVKTQTLTDWEHILADDGSTDESPRIVQQAAANDQRVRPLTSGNRTGPAKTRNRALEAARGRYVAFLDADDLWLPGKLEECLTWMRATNCGFAYHDYRHISADGRKVGGLIKGPDTLNWKTLHTCRGVGCLAVVIDREKVRAFRFPPHYSGPHEDFLCWGQLIRMGHLGRRVPEDLARYRASGVGRNADKVSAAVECWRNYRSESHLPLFRAANWWSQYAWNAYWMHRRGAPR